MHRNADVDDSELIHKCQKPIFQIVIDNVMLMEYKRWNLEVWGYRGVAPGQSVACTQQKTWDG